MKRWFEMGQKRLSRVTKGSIPFSYFLSVKKILNALFFPEIHYGNLGTNRLKITRVLTNQNVYLPVSLTLPFLPMLPL